MIAVLAIGAALAGPLQRVEILSDDPGTWIHYEAPLLTHRPTTAIMRFVEQVQPVWRLPHNLALGTSVAAQSISYERAFGDSGLGWSAGLQTRLLLPSGVLATVSWQKSWFRVAGGISLISGTTWRRPDWTRWDVLPTLSLAWVRRDKAAKLPAEVTSR